MSMTFENRKINKKNKDESPYFFYISKLSMLKSGEFKKSWIVIFKASEIKYIVENLISEVLPWMISLIVFATLPPFDYLWLSIQFYIYSAPMSSKNAQKLKKLAQFYLEC